MYNEYSKVQSIIDEMGSTYTIKNVTLEFYRQKLNKFFTDYMGNEINKARPLNTITYYDLNQFIKMAQCGAADKLNYYNSLKRFFDYTYRTKRTPEIMSKVEKPTRMPRRIVTLSECEYETLTNFIVNPNGDVKERLTLGLFLFTGLSRKYIANIVNDQFVFNGGVYQLTIWLDKQEVSLPLKAELQIIIHEYIKSLNEEDMIKKLFSCDENYLSTIVSRLTKRIINKEYTPTALSSTFISKALKSGNFIWEISNLTLESVTTIEKYVSEPDDLFHKQKSILNAF